MSHRHEQLVSTLHRALSTVISQKLNDPRVRGMVTVTEVDLSPDRKQAQVGISVLPEQYERRTIAALRHGAGRIRKLLDREVAMRSIPELDFRIDRSLKRQAEIYQAIDEGMRREQDAAPSEEQDEQDTPS